MQPTNVDVVSGGKVITIKLPQRHSESTGKQSRPMPTVHSEMYEVCKPTTTYSMSAFPHCCGDVTIEVFETTVPSAP